MSTIPGTRASVPIAPAVPSMAFPMTQPSTIASSASGSDSAGTSAAPATTTRSDTPRFPQRSPVSSVPSTRRRSGTGSMPQLPCERLERWPSGASVSARGQCGRDPALLHRRGARSRAPEPDLRRQAAASRASGSGWARSSRMLDVASGRGGPAVLLARSSAARSTGSRSRPSSRRSRSSARGGRARRAGVVPAGRRLAGGAPGGGLRRRPVPRRELRLGRSRGNARRARAGRAAGRPRRRRRALLAQAATAGGLRGAGRARSRRSRGRCAIMERARSGSSRSSPRRTTTSTATKRSTGARSRSGSRRTATTPTRRHPHASRAVQADVPPARPRVPRLGDLRRLEARGNGMAHPDLPAEQAYLDHAYECLEEMRQALLRTVDACPSAPTARTSPSTARTPG